MDETTWSTLRSAVHGCEECQRLKGLLFQPFATGEWPDLPMPRPNPILFLSEAPPAAGGFWRIAPEAEDGLRANLLPLLGIAEESALVTFRAGGYFLLQSFQQPLVKGLSLGMFTRPELQEILGHQVTGHLTPHLAAIQPKAIQALGATATLALAVVFPTSAFAQAVKADEKITKLSGRLFPPAEGVPLLAATPLPAGPAAGYYQDLWTRDIPAFVREAHRLTLREPARGATL